MASAQTALARLSTFLFVFFSLVLYLMFFRSTEPFPSQIKIASPAISVPPNSTSTPKPIPNVQLQDPTDVPMPAPESPANLNLTPLHPIITQPHHFGLRPQMMLDMYATADHLANPQETAEQHPPYCNRPSLPAPLFNCSHRRFIVVGKQLGAGKSKTVHLASLNGEQFAFKSATLPAQRVQSVKQNSFSERRAVIQMEFNKTLLMDTTEGILRARGGCFIGLDAWALYPFAQRGRFGAELAKTADGHQSLVMAVSLARIFACLEHHPYGFGFISDNKPEQFVVHGDWTVQLADVDGLRFYNPGSRGRMGGKTCRTNLDCVANRRRPDFVLSPDNGCNTALGKCHGEDSRSMVYVLGNMFLALLAPKAPVLQDIVDKCRSKNRDARPTASQVVQLLEKAL